MKIQDIIRNMIELIDNMESEPSTIQQLDQVKSVQSPSPLTYTGDDINRFRQIVDLADLPCEYSNEPDEKYAGLDAVTIHAGGGMNGPKHPADIRVKDPSATPHLIAQDVDQVSQPNPEHIILIKSLRGL